MSVGQAKRYRILKRDGFRCCYCGVTGAQAILEVDHVVPASDGGDDDESNLVTACYDCNRGKSASHVSTHLVFRRRVVARLKQELDRAIQSVKGSGADDRLREAVAIREAMVRVDH